jgi:aminoglycoside phosphotransferase (APT) family kinase protein
MTPDSAAPVRPGEELPQEALGAWLGSILGLSGSPEIRQFPSGYSNLTYLLRIGERELVLRRPPFGARIPSAHDMGREHRMLAALHPRFGKVPRPLGYCDDDSVIGAPFYVMERIRGVILRDPRRVDLDAAAMRRVSELLVDGLAELHGLDWRTPGLAELSRPDGYAGRQVRGWSERYARARTDTLEGVEEAAAWLAENVPRESGASLVHNDYKYDNLVFDPELTRIAAVLDWEMATIGEPLMDLGTTLAYWLDRDDPEPLRATGLLGLTARPGNLSRAEIVERYARATGRDISNIVFYYAFGLFKVAVIVQQIYARYRKGLTRDPRFAGLVQVASACGEQARLAIEKGRIDRLAG